MKKIKLDAYEKQIVKDIEQDEFKPVKNQEKEIKRYKGYFKAMQKKNKRISIRIAEADLQEIQRRAIKTGIPYQRIVTSVLHQYATGKTNIGL